MNDLYDIWFTRDELIKIDGYFKEDSMNITRLNNIFAEKIKLLTNDLNLSNK